MSDVASRGDERTVGAAPREGSSLMRDATALWARIPVVPAWLLVAFVLADAALTVGAIVGFALGWLNPIQTATHGLVTRTLLANLVVLAVIGLLLYTGGRLRPRDVGLRRSDLPLALAVTVGLWLGAQVVGVIVCLFTHTLALDATWRTQGASGMLGVLAGQVFGNALYEEVAWRGFLVPQLFRRFAVRWPIGPWPLVLALAISQSLFGLRHIPILLLERVPLGDLPFDLLDKALLGVVFALFYLRTRNLLVAVGVHALFDAPTALVAPAGGLTIPILAVLLLVVLLVWPHLPARMRRRSW